MTERIKTISGPAKLVNVNDIDTDNIFHASLLTIHEAEKIKNDFYMFATAQNTPSLFHIIFYRQSRDKNSHRRRFGGGKK